MKAVIVEDENRSADVLRSLVGRYCPQIDIISTAETVELAIDAIKSVQPKLIFLDVELPDGSGFKVMEAFPDHYFNVIFVTAHEHYAIKAIRSCALDYLLKPLDIDDLVLAVNKVKNEQYTPELQERKETLLYNNQQKDRFKQKIALPTNEGLLFTRLDEIVYCVADNSYTNFFLKSKEKIIVCKPLNYFEDILDDETFCRTHQSFLVNLNYVKKYVRGRGGYLILNDGTKVEVSTRMKSGFLERFNK